MLIRLLTGGVEARIDAILFFGFQPGGTKSAEEVPDYRKLSTRISSD